jgi:hypothetical protein
MTQFPEDEPSQLFTDLRREGDEDYVDPIGWAERGYVRARFGDIPVLLTPEVAAQIRAFRGKQL